MQNKIVVFGAGAIGSTIVRLLADRFPVEVVDYSVDNLNRLSGAAKYAYSVDFNDASTLYQIAEKNDIIINAAPHFANNVLVNMAIDLKKPYFDMTEDVADTLSPLFSSSRQIQSPLYQQCGLAPGFVSIKANDMAKKFNKVRDIFIRVGALPQYPSNSLGYNLSWSVDGLVNEYIKTGFAIKNGEFSVTTGMEEVESCIVDGIEYEAFNTSGGIGSLATEFQEKALNVNYKTLRYPGHIDKMKFLINDLNISGNDLKQILTKAIPVSDCFNPDKVVIKIVVNGYKTSDYTLSSDVYEKVVLPRMVGGQWLSAIQLTTACSLCAVVMMHIQGLTPKKVGPIYQHELDLHKFEDMPVVSGIYSNSRVFLD